MVSISVKKIWDDANNQDGKRPEKLVVTLSNGQTVTLNEENEWTATIDGLPVYSDGEKIEYTWSEEDLPEGYELTNTEVDGYVTTLTNSYKPETTSIEVTKVWSDDDDEEKIRPTDVTITLLANGKYYDEYKFTATEEWKHTFTDLPVYEEGEKIEYSVIEEEVPTGYEVAYEGNMEEGFIVHNIKGQGDGNPPPHDNPQTGDNIMLYLITLLLSIIGLAGGKIYLKKYEI